VSGTRARLTLAIALALASCNVYDDGGGTAQPPVGNHDASHDDVGGTDPADVAGGGNAGDASGDDGRTGGSGGGGSDVGTGGRDATGDGTGAGDAPADSANRPDADSGGAGGFAGSDAGTDGGIDGLEDGASDGAPICNADSGDATCADVTADVIDDVTDQCPTDPSKTAPGVCGCGVPDTDMDLDGTPDCVDGCPGDIRKTQPGICGCNAEDPMDADAGQAFCLKALLAHRYSFNGTGTVATDSIAAANGAITGGSNATMSGGSVNLTGDLGARYTTEGYVNLPSNLVSPLTNATLEAWVTWRGTGTSGSQQWQRIFDFGDQVTSGSELVGKTYLFVTARAGSSSLARAAFSTNGSANETLVTATQAFPLNAQAHVAVVLDDAGDGMALYLNGSPEGSVAWTGTLASINNVNSWLGRSNYGVDPEFNGVIYEFRIYRAALTAAQVRASYLAGPDPAFF
jgi:hypothetical protein